MKKAFILAAGLCVSLIQAESTMTVSNPTCKGCGSEMVISGDDDTTRVSATCDCKEGTCMNMCVETDSDCVEMKSEEAGSVTVSCSSKDCDSSKCPSTCTDCPKSCSEECRKECTTSKTRSFSRTKKTCPMSRCSRR